jgi:DNA-binding FadR family transcriptional regulator
MLHFPYDDVNNLLRRALLCKTMAKAGQRLRGEDPGFHEAIARRPGNPMSGTFS